VVSGGAVMELVALVEWWMEAVGGGYAGGWMGDGGAPPRRPGRGGGRRWRRRVRERERCQAQFGNGGC
jgi:hypothetical protein